MARDRQRALLIASAVIASTSLLPAVARAAPERRTVALLVAWSVWTAAVALALPSVRRAWRPWLERGALAAAVGFFGALVSITGGLESPAFPWMIALPVAAAVLLREDAAGVAGAGALTVIAVASVAWPSAPEGLAVVQALVAAAVSAFGSSLYRAHLKRDRALQAACLRLWRGLKASEQRLAAAERLAAAGQLAAGVVQEVNDPIAFVRSNITALENALDTGLLFEDDQRELLAEAHAAMERIAHIMESLHTLSRETPPATGPCAVYDAVREALRGLSPGMAAAVELDVAEDAAWVSADRHLLAVIIQNLLSNAVEAAAAGPEIPRVRLSARRRGESVDLFVDDSGQGVPALLRPRLFEPFFTTKPPGLGLGLGLVVAREYASRMGGTLDLESGTGLGGARFRLTLPEIDAKPRPAAAPVLVRERVRRPAQLEAIPLRRLAS